MGRGASEGEMGALPLKILQGARNKKASSNTQTRQTRARTDRNAYEEKQKKTAGGEKKKKGETGSEQNNRHNAQKRKRRNKEDDARGQTPRKRAPEEEPERIQQLIESWRAKYNPEMKREADSDANRG